MRKNKLLKDLELIKTKLLNIFVDEHKNYIFLLVLQNKIKNFQVYSLFK